MSDISSLEPELIDNYFARVNEFSFCENEQRGILLAEILEPLLVFPLLLLYYY